MISEEKEICQIHQLEGIAMEYLQCYKTKFKILCQYCLADKVSHQNVILLKNSKSLLESIKQELKNKYELKIREKLIKIQNLQLIINNYQERSSSSINQINQLINLWIRSTQDQLQSQFELQNVKQLKIHSNFEIGICNLLREISEIEKKIQNSENEDEITLISNLNKSIEYISNQEELFRFQELLQQIPEEWKQIEILDKEEQLQYQKRTPQLQLLCTKHQFEIIMFDLQEQQVRQKRALCIECEPCQFTSLLKCKMLWKNFQDQKIAILKRFYDSMIQSAGNIQVQFSEVLNTNLQKLRNSVNLIVQRVKQSVDIEISKSDDNWNKYSMEDILDIVEILSKPTQQVNLILQLEQEFQLKDWNLQQLIKFKIQHLNQLIREQIIEFLEDLEPNNLDVDFHINESQLFSSISTTISTFNSNHKNENSDKSINKKYYHKQNKNSYQQIKSIIPSQKYIDYQLIYSKSREEWCNTIAFNKNGTIMVSGSKFNIKIWEFQQGKLILQYQITEHEGDVNCLYFCKLNECFISGSDDRTLRLWKMQSKNEWKCAQILKGHSNWIYCFIMNKTEDQIISGSKDSTIKIWKRIDQLDQFRCIQTLEQHSNSILSISLNDNETYLVSSGFDSKIVLWKYDQQYECSQIIECNDIGNRICFLGDDSFFWQPSTYGTLIKFTLNKETEIFERDSIEIFLNEGDEDYQYFPSIYLKEKKLLINKFGRYLYIIKQQENNKIQFEQIIEFKDYRNFGAFTEDGEYLVSWHYISSQFQIRKNAGISRLDQ